MRRSIGPAAGAAFLLCWLGAAQAAPRAVRGTSAGLIVTGNVRLLERPFESVASLKEAMSRLEQPQPISACCDGAWRMHFAARLERPTDDVELDLEFFDVSSRAPAGRVFSATVALEPGQTSLFINDFVVTREQGFAPGHEYEVSLRRPAGSDLGILAKGRLILK